MVIFCQRGSTSWGFQVGRLYMYWPFLSFWRCGCRLTFGWEER